MTQKEETSLENNEYKLHENGLMYREIEFEGLDDPLKLFISIKPQRLEGETQTEYKMRRMLERRGDMIKKYEPEMISKGPKRFEKGIPYVNVNKKDKFKKEKK